MSNYAIMRVNKLKKTGNIGGSGQHAFRERNTPNADPRRLGDNQTLRGPTSARGIIEAVQERLKVPKHRHDDAVLALEYLFTFSPEASIRSDPSGYFKACLAWLDELHRAENVVSAVVHNDETTPHLCAYVVPIHHREGRERKRNVADGRNPDGTQRRKVITQVVGEEVWLSAAAYIGSKKKLSQLQTDFAKKVGRPHGLVRGVEGSRATHTTIKQFYGFMAGQGVVGNDEQRAKLAGAAAKMARQHKAQAEEALRQAERLRIELSRAKEEFERKQLQTAEQLKREYLEKEARRRDEQLAAQRALEADRAKSTQQVRELQATVDRLRAQLTEVVQWAKQLVGRCWTALWSGDVSAVKGELTAASAKLREPLQDPPEWRIELRELESGEWRASLLDAQDREHYSVTCDSAEEAAAQVRDWMSQRFGAAPGM